MLPLAVFALSKQVINACEVFNITNCQFGQTCRPVRMAVPRRSLPTEYLPVKVKDRPPLPALKSSMPPVIFPFPSAVKLPTAIIVPVVPFCPAKENAYCPCSALLFVPGPRLGPFEELLPPQPIMKNAAATRLTTEPTRTPPCQELLNMDTSRHEELLTFLTHTVAKSCCANLISEQIEQ